MKQIVVVQHGLLFSGEKEINKKIILFEDQGWELCDTQSGFGRTILTFQKDKDN